MYRIEKIGQLILVTMENEVSDEEIKTIKKELKNLAAVDDEVVVSLNQANMDGTKKPVDSKSRYQEIIDYCIESSIRIYSYACE
jgi:hypothetical protein